MRHAPANRALHGFREGCGAAGQAAEAAARRPGGLWQRRQRRRCAVGAGRIALAAGLAFGAIFTAACNEHLPQIVDETLIALSSDANVERLRKLAIEVPALRIASRELTLGVFDALDEGLTETDRAERLQAASAEYVAAIAVAVANALDEELGPALRDELVTTVHDVLDETLTHESWDDFSATTAAISEATTLALVEGLSEGLDTHLAPALERMLVERLAPALTASLEDATPAIAATARETAHQAVLGVNDGVIESLEDERLHDALRRATEAALQPVEGVLDEAQETARWWRNVLIALGIVLALVAAILVILYYRRQARRRDETIEMITAAIRRADDEERRDRPTGASTAADKVLDELRAVRGRYGEGRRYLDQFLDEHPSLRVRRDREGDSP